MAVRGSGLGDTLRLQARAARRDAVMRQLMGNCAVHSEVHRRPAMFCVLPCASLVYFKIEFKKSFSNGVSPDKESR